ncbi:hypothetical protein DPMN_142274 [Dreissena polymorpha]|uniref:Uncharacterized protein n=1 Tax=Dreissena polymorpha TaxID=45954 RepID=A0A9D4GAZ6_DREPO|nr:hypothetical protein DPMN_142274 [Dreissena polymorpha]
MRVDSFRSTGPCVDVSGMLSRSSYSWVHDVLSEDLGPLILGFLVLVAVSSCG